MALPYNSPSLGHARVNSCATLVQVICQTTRTPSMVLKEKAAIRRGTKSAQGGLYVRRLGNFLKLI